MSARQWDRETGRPVSPLPVLAVTLLGVPVMAYVVSHAAMSIFVDRYMLPSAMGWSILLAHGIARLGTSHSSGSVKSGAPRWWHLPEGGLLDRGVTMSWVALCAVLLVRPVFRALDLPTFPRPGSEVLTLASAGTPVAIESPIEYLPMTHYSGAPGRPFFVILDWEDALDPKATLQATVDYKVMTRWKANGYLADGIVQGDAFLCAHDRFLVVDTPQHLWFEKRVKNNPAFVSRVVGDNPSYATGWIRYTRYLLVERRAGVTLPGCT
jgi:hypothetical protein